MTDASNPIRLAAAADLPAVHALVERAYRGDSARAGWTHEADLLGGQRVDRAMLADILADPDRRLLLSEDGGTIIGCVEIARKPGAIAYLGLLTVDPARQAGGLGRRLLAAAESEARRLWRSETIEMTVIVQRLDLIAWYQRRGYALTGERRPFPHGDARFGTPTTDDLEFVVLAKTFDEAASAKAPANRTG